ncbi:uncharacterized protein EDB93DRAFT_1150029 [Suillus bovinus]|uniref:uncharacterized protein n=1 Tax=Suillus bovinus TaxID=48563 RepID=UPI001B868B16|nr:uncharacterized protein EDB93DRAFT_1150029 [Suillus bovinus]KAG2146155.1 hypothetical protein EDB93DRAFT_1150029 [Suillus bovinus]
MISFIGRLPVSVIFDADSSCCLVSTSVAHDLGHSAPGSRFFEILTASYDGHALTTDVEFKVARDLDCDVLIGMNWIAAWRAVGREDESSVHHPYSCAMSGSQATSCILGGSASRLPESPVSGNVDLSQSSSLAGAVSSSCRRSKSIVHDILFKSCRSGVRLGPWSSEIALLDRVCALHGLELKGPYSLLELRKSLLRHLLHGDCVASDTRSKHRDYTACREIASGFASPSDLVEFTLDELTSGSLRRVFVAVWSALVIKKHISGIKLSVF